MMIVCVVRRNSLLQYRVKNLLFVWCGFGVVGGFNISFFLSKTMEKPLL